MFVLMRWEKCSRKEKIHTRWWVGGPSPGGWVGVVGALLLRNSASSVEVWAKQDQARSAARSAIVISQQKIRKINKCKTGRKKKEKMTIINVIAAPP